MTPKSGDLVGDLTFLRSDGSTVSLSSFRGRPLLLVFLRHMA
jgi:peroxiredoxin